MTQLCRTTPGARSSVKPATRDGHSPPSRGKGRPDFHGPSGVRAALHDRCSHAYRGGHAARNHATATVESPPEITQSRHRTRIRREESTQEDTRIWGESSARSRYV